MGLIIHPEKVNDKTAAAVLSLCPFGALDYENGILSVNSGCRNCRMCVRKGPEGLMTWEEEKKTEVFDPSSWRGVAVFAEERDGRIHPVTLELLGKARELAAVISHPVYALLIGSGGEPLARELLHYGADKVFLYDNPSLGRFTVSPYAAAFTDFISKIRPSSILVGATNLGRSLAPRVAARCGTGLTADCTVLQMKENTDLVQIRPAFGGNIMAQIVTPRTRPQFCTVRYKVFSPPGRSEAECGEIVRMAVTPDMKRSGTEILEVREKPREIDISEAETIVAFGRGVSKESDIAMIRELADLLGAQLAGTRPTVEAGWTDPRRQIGLSGRTVKPKLILTVGISGSVQFAAGMKNSDCIIAINSDPNAGIFDIAHLGIVGDLYEIVPMLISKIREAKHV